MTDLPLGWAETTLGEIAETSLGKMLDRGKGSGTDQVPYLRNVNVQWGRIDLRDILTMDIPPEEREFFRLRPDDLLVCEGGEVGRCAIWVGGDEYMAYQKALHRIRLHEVVHPKFVRYFIEFMSISGNLVPYSTGSTIRHLPQQQLRRIPIRLPPRFEQRRIVAALEGHLSRLGVAGGFLESCCFRLRMLRQSVLEDAVGRLCAGPAMSLGNILREPLRNGHSAQASRSGFGIRTLTLSAVTHNNFCERNTKLTTADPSRVAKLWLEPGDILIQRSNTPDLVGTSALYRGVSNWAIFPDLLIRVRVSDDFIPEYVQLILSSDRVMSHMRSSAKGLAGSMPKIDQPTIEKIQIPGISKTRQVEFVEEVSRLQCAASNLMQGVELASVRQAGLRRAVLAEAFAGRLVAQEPADEPASVLLERIRAERAAHAPVRRARRGKGEQAPQKETLL